MDEGLLGCSSTQMGVRVRYVSVGPAGAAVCMSSMGTSLRVCRAGRMVRHTDERCLLEQLAGIEVARPSPNRLSHRISSYARIPGVTDDTCTIFVSKLLAVSPAGQS